MEFFEGAEKENKLLCGTGMLPASLIDLQYPYMHISLYHSNTISYIASGTLWYIRNEHLPRNYFEN